MLHAGLCLPGKGQSTDSLKNILSATKLSKPALEQYLLQIQNTDIVKIDELTVMGNWIIEHCIADSLKELKAKTYFALGRIYTLSARFADATRYLIQARQLAEENEFTAVQSQAVNALGIIYQDNDQVDRAIAFFTESLELSKKVQDGRGTSRALYNLGKIKFYNSTIHKDQLQAAHQMLSGFTIARQLNDTQGIITQSNGLIDVYLALNKRDSAILLFGGIEPLVRASNKQMNYLNYYSKLAALYNSLSKYATALEYYHYGLSIAEQYKTPRILCSYYAGLAETYELAGDYKNANKYNRKNIEMHNELVSKENFAAAADLQNKYERTKKDNEILQLSATNRQKTIVNSILVVSSIVLLIVFYLLYQYFKNRSKIAAQQTAIHHQKIIELEKEKQFLAVDAMLKGQEEERSRIAKDLHDGLGGLLSGTKLSLINIKDNLPLTRETALQFDRSLSMLDNTISDLRKTAHNLMPEALMKFGLLEALTDYCNSIRTSTGMDVIFQHYGEQRRLSNTASVSVYRIVQELVNNALKHSSATQVLVQLTIRQQKTELTVEDNGCGFNPAVKPDSTGSGLLNVEHRAQYFNGRIDIASSPGNGTSVQIELLA